MSGMCRVSRSIEKRDTCPRDGRALRRFNRAIERQGQESRFCGNEGDVIDVGPEGMKPLAQNFLLLLIAT